MVGNQAHIEGDLQGPLKFAFKWINAPYYDTDLSVYVFRPYGKRPQVQTLDLILTSMQYKDIGQAIVVVNSHNTVTELRYSLPHFFPQYEVSSLRYIMRLFQAVGAKTTDELVTFLTKACGENNHMVSTTMRDNTFQPWYAQNTRQPVLGCSCHSFGLIVTMCPIFLLSNKGRPIAIYWLISTVWMAIMMFFVVNVVALGVMGALYSISFLALWLMKPDLYYIHT